MNPYTNVNRINEYNEWCMSQQQNRKLPTYEEWLSGKR